MQVMSYRSNIFLASDSKVNIVKPAVWLTITYRLTVTQVGLPRAQYPTRMSHTESFNTSVQEVMLWSINEPVFIGDLSDIALQIIFNAWWALLNVGSKWPFSLNNSRYVPSRRLYYSAELRRPAALRLYVSFVSKFFAIHQNMYPAQLANTLLEEGTSQS